MMAIFALFLLITLKAPPIGYLIFGVILVAPGFVAFLNKGK